MKEEAEKVINLSLCKMAESRAIKRGGSSLHKHLLISSVLTKARSAWENLFLDQVPTQVSSNQTVAAPGQLSAEECVVSSLESQLFAGVETEDELPPDILNCVEKLGEFSEQGFAPLSDGSLLDEVDAATADMILSNEARCNTSVYDDLSAGLNKRRRGWSLDLQDDDSDDETDPVLGSLSVNNTAKRLRFSTNEAPTFRSLEPSSIFLSESRALDPFFTSFTSKGSSFRTKKSHFDVEEEESEEIDPFLEEEEDWHDVLQAKNDRRVPSSNGSCSSSSSDEEVDGVSAMEVDKLTTLVQYFTFKAPTVPGSPPKSSGGLVRSMSTPELCSRTNSLKNAEAPPPTAQDLFSSYSTSSHHHFLTMKV